MDFDYLVNHPQFEQVRMLGSGAFGSVLLARERQHGNYVAIKLIPKEKVSNYVESEILNHRRLRHAHIIDFLGVFLLSDHMAIVMEYAEAGDMFAYVARKPGGKLDEASARWWFQQLVLAIDYCHKQGVVNRDIKLENTLLKTYTNPDKPSNPIMLLKLCDFGYSKHEAESDPKSLVGTPAYLAPEVIKCRHGETYNAQAVDIWSCGVWLYTMLQGHPPFMKTEDTRLPGVARSTRIMQRILNDDISLPKGISSQCGELLSRILVKDPLHRLDMKGIIMNPWFQEGLPAEAISMNEYWSSQPVPEQLQSEAEIKALIRNLRHT